MGAIYAIGQRFAEARGNGETAGQAFAASYSPVEVIFDPNCSNCHNETACGSQMSGTVIYNGQNVNCTPGGAYSPPGGNQIIIASLVNQAVLNMVHEFGHVFDHQHGDYPRTVMPQWMYTGRDLFLAPNPCNGCYLWQMHPPSNYHDAYTAGETFGELFIAWVYGVWNTSNTVENINAVTSAQRWMDNGMIYGNWSP